MQLPDIDGPLPEALELASNLIDQEAAATACIPVPQDAASVVLTPEDAQLIQQIQLAKADPANGEHRIQLCDAMGNKHWIQLIQLVAADSADSAARDEWFACLNDKDMATILAENNGGDDGNGDVAPAPPPAPSPPLAAHDDIDSDMVDVDVPGGGGRG